MPIYRGEGGAGEATNTATVTLITQKASEASAAAAAALVSENAAALSESNASTSETNAAASETAAANSAGVAALNATSAANSAASAATSASDANTAATAFLNSEAYNITSTDTTNWDTAFGWGDHSVVGYLTTETDPVFTAWDKSTGISITESQISDFGTYEPADADIAKTDVTQSFTAAQRGSTQTNATTTGSVTLDFATYQNFVLTMTGNVTLANPSTEAVGQSGFIVFIQDATGGRTVSLGTDYETAGGTGLTLSSAASTTDVVPYIVVASGRILLGAPQKGFV